MAKKKNKPKDKIRARIKRERRLEKEKEAKFVRFRCLECGKEEDIPRDVVERLDYEDGGGDLSVPPRFDCTECDGQMEPIHYRSVHGITYQINKE